MTIPGLLARGRAAHRRLMLDAVRIERRTGRTFDEASGEYVDTWQSVYAGPADVRAQALEAQQRDAGQTDTTTDRYDVKIPHNTQPVIRVEDRVIVTSSGDPRLIGRPLLITAVGLGTRRTAWHLSTVDQEQP